MIEIRGERMLLIKGGRVIDPRNHRNEIADILVKDGKIERIAENIEIDGVQVIDATDRVVAPGFVDIHVHLREPGYEYKETIKTGTWAAAAGGFTSIACMPNTKPAIHSREVVEYIKKKAEAEGVIHVFPIGSITHELEGEKLTNVQELVEAGVVAISDDGKTPINVKVVREAFSQAKACGILVIDHCEDHHLAKGGSIHEGAVSQRTGIPGIPAEAEWRMVERDIQLAEELGTALHIAHVSAKESVIRIRKAKKRGVPITCEIAPHHFTLTDEVICPENSYTKVNPPLRAAEDVEEMLRGIMDGTIDILATDHAPHDEESKRLPYGEAPFGISGIETAFSIAHTELVLTGKITIDHLVHMMSTKPAEIVGIDKGSLTIGKDADIVIFDTDTEETIDARRFVSKGKNTPFQGKKVTGKVLYTIVNGKIVFQEGEIICSSIN